MLAALFILSSDPRLLNRRYRRRETPLHRRRHLDRRRSLKAAAAAGVAWIVERGPRHERNSCASVIAVNDGMTVSRT